MADPRYRESMRLIEEYSLLPFMTPRQYYYPRVVLQFYHSMTSRGGDSPHELQFSIDDRPGVLRAAGISTALGLRIPSRNSEGYRDWAHPPHREMVRALARDTTAGPVFYRRQLPPQMLLIDHLFRTSLFPLQHYVQRRGAILEALYRISGGFWFSPSELVMASLLQFRGKGPSEGPGTSREPAIAYAATPVLCSRASGIPRGAQARDEGPMPSGHVSRAGDDYARLFPHTTAGPGGGTGSGG